MEPGRLTLQRAYKLLWAEAIARTVYLLAFPIQHAGSIMVVRSPPDVTTSPPTKRLNHLGLAILSLTHGDLFSANRRQNLVLLTADAIGTPAAEVTSVHHVPLISRYEIAAGRDPG
jgi:hypothetical protein